MKNNLWKKNLATLMPTHPDIAKKIKNQKNNLKKQIVIKNQNDGKKWMYFISRNGQHIPVDGNFDIIGWGPSAERCPYKKDFDGIAVFIGMGLGMAPMFILKNCPHIRKIVIFEPIEEVFSAAISNIDLTELFNSKKVHINLGRSINQKEIEDFLYLTAAFKDIRISQNTAYRKFWGGFNEFLQEVFSLLNSINIGASTHRLAGPFEFKNLFENLELLSVASDFSRLRGVFSGLPAVCIAAGPSLSQSYEFLRSISDSAILIAADSALYPLIKQDIIPDMVTSLDFQALNFEKLSFLMKLPEVASRISWIGHVASTPVIPKRIGFKRLFFYLSNDISYRWLMEASSIRTAMTGRLGSVSVLSLMTAIYGGAKDIFLIGQDLAYSPEGRDSAGSDNNAEKTHAKGVLYKESVWEPQDVYIDVSSVTGHAVKTQRMWLDHKANIEEIISAYARHIPVYNLSPFGAAINMTSAISFENALNHIKKQKIKDKKTVITQKLANIPPILSSEHRRNKFLNSLKDILYRCQKKREDLKTLLGTFSSVSASSYDITDLWRDFLSVWKDDRFWTMLSKRLISAFFDAQEISCELEGAEGETRDNDRSIRLYKRLYGAILFLISTVRLFEKTLTKIINILSDKIEEKDENKIPALIECANYRLLRDYIYNNEYAQNAHKEPPLALWAMSLLAFQYDKALSYFKDIEKGHFEAAIKTLIKREAMLWSSIIIKHLNLSPAAREGIVKRIAEITEFSIETERIKGLIAIFLKMFGEDRKKKILSENVSQRTMQLLEEFYREFSGIRPFYNIIDRKNFYIIAEMLSLYARMLLEAGMIQDGVNALTEAVAISPKEAVLWEELGDFCLENGMIDDAIASYERCFNALPERIDILKKMADAYYKNGDLEASRAALEIYKDKLINASSNLNSHNPQQDNLQDSQQDEAMTDELQEEIRRRIVSLREANQLNEAHRICLMAIEKAPENAEFYFQLGIILFNKGDKNGALNAFKGAVELNPEHLDARYNLGVCLYETGQMQEALNVMLAICEVSQPSSELLNAIGNIYSALDEHETALSYYKRAHKLDSSNVSALINIGHERYLLEDLYGAKEALAQAISLEKDNLKANYNYANVWFALKDYDRAEKYFRRAIEIDPDVPQAHWNLSHVLMLKGRWEEGFKEYLWRWKRDRSLWPDDLLVPEWRGEEINGDKTIFIWCEQGLGDAIQFIRYLPLVKRRFKRALLGGLPPLFSLMAAIDSIDWVFDKMAYKSFEGIMDYHCPLLNLPTIFGVKDDWEIPYITPDSLLSRAYSAIFKAIGKDRRLKAGIVWQGSPKHKNDKKRSIALEEFAPLFDLTDIQWFSLQKGYTKENLQDFPIYDLSSYLLDFSHLGALLSHLDLLISVDTAPCHLAGAMGMDVWTLIPYNPDWRWGKDGDKTFWYPTMRLFRQQERNNWKETIEEVREALLHYSS